MDAEHAPYISGSEATGVAMEAQNNQRASNGQNIGHLFDNIIEEDFRMHFELLVNEMGLSDEKKLAMLALTKEKKVILMSQSRWAAALIEKSNRMDPATAAARLEISDDSSPSLIIERLIAVEVSARTETTSWLITFLEETSGLNFIFAIIERYCFSNAPAEMEFDVLYQAVNCIKTLINFRTGLSSVLHYPCGIALILCCYPPRKSKKDIKLKCLILELIAVMAMLPGGLKIVLAAFDDYCSSKKEKHRFTTMIADLAHFPIDFKKIAFACINSIVNSSDSCNIRMALRFEMLDRGLRDIIKNLKTLQNAEIQAQIRLFNNDGYLKVTEGTATSELYEFDQMQIFEKLKNLDDSSSKMITMLIVKFLTMTSSDEVRLNCAEALHEALNRILLNIDEAGILDVKLLSQDRNKYLRNAHSRRPLKIDISHSSTCESLNSLIADASMNDRSPEAQTNESKVRRISEIAQSVYDLRGREEARHSNDPTLKSGDTIAPRADREKKSNLASAITGSFRQLKSAILEIRSPRRESAYSPQTPKAEPDGHYRQHGRGGLISAPSTPVGRGPETGGMPVFVMPPLESLVSSPILQRRISELNSTPANGNILPEKSKELETVNSTAAADQDKSSRKPSQSLERRRQSLRSSPAVVQLALISPLAFAPLSNITPSSVQEGKKNLNEDAESATANETQVGQNLMPKRSYVKPTGSTPQQSPPLSQNDRKLQPPPPPPPPPPPLQQNLKLGPPPPPPPPLLKGGPPPPPPPLLKGGPPPPPPPPGTKLSGGPKANSTGADAGEAAQTKIVSKTKNFMWSKLSQTAATSIFWQNVVAVESAINFKELEELFANTPATAATPPMLRNEKGAEKPGAAPIGKHKVSIIDTKRAYNIGIVVARLKTPVLGIAKAVIENNKDILDLNFLQFLKANLPTKDDGDLLQPFLSKPQGLEELERPDQLIASLIGIQRLEIRIDCMITLRTFHDRQKNLLDSGQALLDGTNRISSGVAIKKLLGLILSIGNHLNQNTFRGKAGGFNLSCLALVKGMKYSNDKSRSMIHFLAETLKNELPLLEADVEAFKKASKVSLQVLRQETVDLSLAFHALLEEIPMQTNPFKAEISQFVAANEHDLLVAVHLSEKATKEFKITVSAFGEDPAKAVAFEFFNLFMQFIAEIKKAFVDNAVYETLKSRPRTASVANRLKLDPKEAQKKNVVDDFFSTIKTGDAFKNKRPAGESGGCGIAR